MSSQSQYSSQAERSPGVPQLTEAYRNAKTQYVFASFGLAFWELSGIKIVTTEKWGIELSRAVPLALFAVVLFCGYRMTIEWMRCGLEGNTPRKIQYWKHHVIGIGAIVSFLAHCLWTVG